MTCCPFCGTNLQVRKTTSFSVRAVAVNHLSLDTWKPFNQAKECVMFHTNEFKSLLIWLIIILLPLVPGETGLPGW